MRPRDSLVHMDSCQLPYRLLIEQLERTERTDGLFPWLEANPGEREWLEAFAARPGDPVPPADPVDLYRLYALSRLVQTLTRAFQIGPSTEDPWPGPAIDVEVFTRFFHALGLQTVTPRTYCPFDHEVVHLDTVEGPGIPIIRQVLWPRLMLGNLLIARAGIRLHASQDVFPLQHIATSTLYWAYRRRLRPVQDLSHGWGHNSQWRTSFRRDYRFGTELWFNVDGSLDLAASTPPADPELRELLDELPRNVRKERLIHRSFVHTPPVDDPWPYDDRLVLDESALLSHAPEHRCNVAT